MEGINREKGIFLVMMVIFLLSMTMIASAQELTIAVIPLSLGHPWWVRCGEGAMKAGEELGINIIYTAPEKKMPPNNWIILTTKLIKALMPFFWQQLMPKP